MAYKDWLNEQASNKNAGMNNIKPADIPAAKQMAPAGGVKAPSTNAGGGNSTPTTNTGATGAENGAGGTTGGSMTYEDWYATNKQHYDDLYQQTLAEIEANRQKNIQDATAAQRKLVGTYGAQAERLSSMGLTGGGYSDYLTAQAHANMRSGVQAANATAEQGRLDAQQDYNKTMLGLAEQLYQREQTKKANIATVDAKISSGGYGSIKAMRSELEAMGLDEETINAKIAENEEVIARNIKDRLLTIGQTDDGEGNVTETIVAKTDAEIDKFVENDVISQATADALKKERDQMVADKIKEMAKNSEDINNVQSYLFNYWDSLPKDAAQALNYEYNAKIALDNLSYKTIGEELNALYEEVSEGYLSEQDAVALSAYKVSHIAKEVYIPSVDMQVFPAKTGQKYTKIKGDGVELEAYSSGVSDAMNKALTEYAGNKAGTIVTFGGNNAVPYVFDGEKWHALYNKKGIDAKSWEKLTYSLPEKDSGYSGWLTEE